MKKLLTTREINELIEEYGLTMYIRDIADILNVTSNSIRQRIQRHNLFMLKESGKKTSHESIRFFTKCGKTEMECIEDIKTLIILGETNQQISKKYQVSETVISKFKTLHKIPNRRPNLRNHNILEQMYTVDKLSQVAIAQKLQCSPAAISQKLSKYLIKKRTLSEVQKLARNNITSNFTVSGLQTYPNTVSNFGYVLQYNDLIFYSLGEFTFYLLCIKNNVASLEVHPEQSNRAIFFPDFKINDINIEIKVGFCDHRKHSYYSNITNAPLALIDFNTTLMPVYTHVKHTLKTHNNIKLGVINYIPNIDMLLVDIPILDVISLIQTYKIR